MPAKREAFYRPIQWSRQRRCRNCYSLNSHWANLCPWCRRAGRWGIFMGGLAGGLAYTMLVLFRG